MRKIISVVLVSMGLFLFSGCTDADIASYNLSEDADNFNRIRQKSPILYRWVMNAVRYEGYRW